MGGDGLDQQMKADTLVKNKKFEFRKAMVWEPEIEIFVRARLEGRVLNVCGESKIGDERIDIGETSTRTRFGDMNEIPFPNNEFDCVVSDPPWGINFYKRMRPFFECVRVCKVGGRIIYNATWIPESKATELEELWVRKSASFGNISALTVFRKRTDEFDGAKK